jgi:hypothetical protein
MLAKMFIHENLIKAMGTLSTSDGFCLWISSIKLLVILFDITNSVKKVIEKLIVVQLAKKIPAIYGT